MKKDVLQFFDLNQIGYTRLLNCILRSRNLLFGEKVILNILFSHAYNFRDCKIKHTVIAQGAGCGVSTVKRYLNNLKEKSIIEWRKISFGRCNQYFINSTISELIEEAVPKKRKSPNQLADKLTIGSGMDSQLAHPRSNEKKTTLENKFLKTIKEDGNKKSFRRVYDKPLIDPKSEHEAVVHSKKLGGEKVLPQCRYAVSNFSLKEVDYALAATQDCKARGGIKKKEIAYFLGVLKRKKPVLQS